MFVEIVDIFIIFRRKIRLVINTNAHQKRDVTWRSNSSPPTQHESGGKTIKSFLRGAQLRTDDDDR